MALHHVVPGEKVHLASRASAAETRTAALVKTGSFEAAQLVLSAGESIAPHSVPGYATIQCLDGKVTLETDEPIELRSGDWLYLDRGQEHSLRAVEDTSLLLTILFD
jgi:quercetin dioxygenase-like cupin family protein